MRQMLTLILRSWPTVLVLVCLAGVGWWGHRNGWKMPKVNELFGRTPQAKDDWCNAHSVAASQCVECKPELLPPGKDHGWCKLHGVHQCPLCHPETVQLPEPVAVSPAELQRVQSALNLRPRPANNSRCPLYKRRVQFASLDAMAKAGVDVAIAEERPIVETIQANGETAFDPTRVARLAARVPGAVWRVEKQIGDRVEEGEVVALIDAADVGKAKAEYLQAFVQARTKAQLLDNLESSESVSPRSVQDAKATLSEARIRLVSARQSLVNLGLPVDDEQWKNLPEDRLAANVQFLGLPPTLTRPFNPATTSGNLLPIKAPFAGVVVAREAVAGDVVDSSRVLFTVVDTRRLILTLNVPQEDAAYLELGQAVLFDAQAAGVKANGRIGWISPAVEEKTRTVKVRVDVANEGGRLRANTFGTARVVLRQEPKALVVPDEAVHWDGSCHVVFVRDKNFLKEGAPKVFHTRTVRVGVKEGGATEIIAGLVSNEIVASKGSGVLRAELLKGNLGAG